MKELQMIYYSNTDIPPDIPQPKPHTHKNLPLPAPAEQWGVCNRPCEAQARLIQVKVHLFSTGLQRKLSGVCNHGDVGISRLQSESET